MQTMNQSLASLYLQRLITLETAMAASSNGRAAGHDQPRRRRRAPARAWAAPGGMPPRPAARRRTGSRFGSRDSAAQHRRFGIRDSDREQALCRPLPIRDARAAGETVSGERVADTMDAAVAALRREQILVTRITPAKAKAEAAAKKAKARQDRQEGRRQEPRRLHPAVLGHDRRRACRSCSASTSSATRRRTRTSRPSSCRRATDVEVGRVARRRDEASTRRPSTRSSRT